MSLKTTAGMSHGFYPARRRLKDYTWTTLIVPRRDSVCGFGQGESDRRFQRQLPLQGAQIAGLPGGAR